MLTRVFFRIVCLLVGAIFTAAEIGCDRDVDTAPPPVIDEVEVAPDLGAEPAPGPASDGIDIDNDGTIDEPDEALDPTSDGIDNDNDGAIDEPDEAISE